MVCTCIRLRIPRFCRRTQGLTVGANFSCYPRPLLALCSKNEHVTTSSDTDCARRTHKTGKMKYRVGEIIGLVPDAAPAFKHSKIKKWESIDPPNVSSPRLGYRCWPRRRRQSSCRRSRLLPSARWPVPVRALNRQDTSPTAYVPGANCAVLNEIALAMQPVVLLGDVPTSCRDALSHESNLRSGEVNTPIVRITLLLKKYKKCPISQPTSSVFARLFAESNF